MTRKVFESRQARDYIKTESYQHDRILKMLGERDYWLGQRDHAKITRKREFCQGMADMYVKRIKWYLR